MLKNYKDVKVSEETVRSLYRNQLYREKLMAQIVAETPNTEEQVWARHILIKDAQLATAVYEKLNAGDNFAEAAGQYSEDTGSAANGGDLPRALAAAPRVEDWIRELPDGRIEVLSGRAELGQGVRTALAQVVAAELDVPVDRIVVRSAGTDVTPDEGYTAGSASLEQGGDVLARAAAAFRRLRAQGRTPTGPRTLMLHRRAAFASV